MKVSTPETNPSSEFTQREELKDPCPQSWLMMKMRTDNPAPMIARGTASHHATLQAQIMIAQSKTYEPCEFTTCQNAFPLSGRWKGSTRARHSAGDGWRPEPSAVSLMSVGDSNPTCAYQPLAGCCCVRQ